MQSSPFVRVSEHVYRLAPDETTDRPVLGLVVGSRATLLVDAGNSPKHINLLFSEMQKLGLALPSYVLLTHWHWDHVFGISAFDVPVFAHEETALVIKEMVGWDWSDKALDQRVEAGLEIEFCREMFKAEWPDRRDVQLRLPDVAFRDNLVFDLGDVHCQFKHVGGDHSPDSSVAFIPEDSILFMGDCLYEDLHHGKPNYTATKLFPLLDDLLGFDAEHYFWGHSPDAMPRAEMLAYTAKLKLIGELVGKIGKDRDQLLENLQTNLDRDLEEEDIEMADAFLAGIKPN